MTTLTDPKEFLDYPELVARMQERGMTIPNPQRAERKIAQVGYYRLSGYYYPCRRYQFDEDRRTRVILNQFQVGTSFDELFKLYIMDKQLRIEFINALERIEIHFRTIIAHELGRIDPQAHLNKKNFNKNAFKEGAVIRYDDVITRYNKLIDESKEDSIAHHIKTQKAIPLWVACETWDFGMISRLFSILNGTHQQSICDRIGIRGKDSISTVENWLINLNVVRNRCAHHARLFNRTNVRGLKIPRMGYFNTLQLNNNATYRLYGIIAIVWFLLTRISTSSLWIRRVADIIDTLPSLPGVWHNSMGFPKDSTNFPRQLFPESMSQEVVDTVIPPHEESMKTFEAFAASIKQLDNLTPEQKQYLSPLPEKLESIYIKLDDKI